MQHAQRSLPYRSEALSRGGGAVVRSGATANHCDVGGQIMQLSLHPVASMAQRMFIE